MKLLALETSSIACSVALQLDDVVTERYEEQPREHTRLLMPMIESVLAESNVKLTDLDAIVLGNGPGSFIGMRIAASVAQGLAFGSGLKIVPVSSLAAIAAQVIDQHEMAEVVVAQDAHMQEVYLGIYRPDTRKLPVAVSDERLHGVGNIVALDLSLEGPRVAAGFGWRRYPELFALNQEPIADLVPIDHPRARYLLPLGAAEFELGSAVRPQEIVPAYLRKKVAEKPVSTRKQV